MPVYDIFFFGAVFFLLGIVFASIQLKFWIIIIAAVLAAFFLILRFILKKKRFFWLCGLFFLIIIGALYFEADNQKFLSIQIPFEQKILFAGVIKNQPTIKNNSQEFYLKLHEPFRGNVLVKAPLYPGFNYGDELRVSGVIKKPFSESYAKYLAKERVSGVISFSEIELVASGRGNFIKNFLFGVRKSVIATFQKVLPPKESAFLTGLTLGGRSEFSEDFKKAMSLSGTTHLVALSGYNITIIIWAVMGIFRYLFSRRLSFIFTIFIIIGFVLMTGAESSVVRAAIMGILVILAREVGRLHDFRNAIILAALIMILANPKVLIFDVGFQLSFLAVLGIVYLRPAIQKFLHIQENAGFLSWRDNLLTTASAQLAVAPFLIQNFGSFSPTSLIANVLVLWLIPFTMGLGFLTVTVSFLSYYFALVFGWLAWIPLRFEIFIIELFAKLSLPIRAELGLFMFSIYYLMIAAFIFYMQKKNVRQT